MLPDALYELLHTIVDSMLSNRDRAELHALIEDLRKVAAPAAAEVPPPSYTDLTPED